MQNDNTMPNDETVESAADSRPTARAKFEEAVTKGARVRQSETWTVLFQQFNEAGIVSKDIDWPRLDLGENAFVEVLDVETHGARLANMLTMRKRHAAVCGLETPEEVVTILSVRDLLETARIERDGQAFESLLRTAIEAGRTGVR